LKQGVAQNAKGFDFIGYRELREVLAGRMRLDEAREAIQQATRRYAKRQVTWFRREHGVEWLNGFGDEERIQKQAREKIQAVAGDLC
jgi:tRNA dimethylallyltransferase